MDLSQVSDADLLASLPQGGRSAPPAQRELPDAEVSGAGPWHDYATPKNVAGLVAAEARRQGVDPRLALGVAHRESGFNPSARSPKGAIGVMQLMPTTAADLGVDPHDPVQNIRGGVTYLKQQLDRFGSPHLALAAYNAGPGAVQRARGVPNNPETLNYVRSIAGPQPGEMSGAEVSGAAPNAFDQFDQHAAPNPFDQFDDHGGARGPWNDYAAADLSKVSDADLLASLPPQARGPAGGSTPQASGGVRPVLNPETGQLYGPAQQRAYAALQHQGALDPSAAPGSRAFPRGLTSPNDTPKPGEWYVDLGGQLLQAPGAPGKAPTIAEDMGAGFAAPWERLGHDFMEAKRRSDARLIAEPPKSVAGFASQSWQDIKEPFRLAGDVLGLTSSPLQALVRPVARALPDPYSTPQFSVKGGKVSIIPSRRLSGDEAQASKEDMINTALSGVRPVGARGGVPKPLSLDELEIAKRAAYAKVDAAGFTFPARDVKGVAADVVAEVAKKGPTAARLYPDSVAFSDRLTALADQPGGVPLTQLEDLRGDVYDALIKPGGKEAQLGRTIRGKIDALIDAANTPDIRAARQANMQYRKALDVTQRLEDADLNRVGSGTGGNSNATRQALKPLLKNKSAARMNNATPDELAALRRAVRGGVGQNLLRAASAFDPFHSKLGALLQGLGFAQTGGLSTATIPVGIGATYGERALQQANINRLLAVIGNGGVRPRFVPPSPALPGSVALASPRGLIGAGVISRQLAPEPVAPGYARTKPR